MPNIYKFNYFCWISKVLILNKLKWMKNYADFKAQSEAKKERNYSSPIVQF